MTNIQKLVVVIMCAVSVNWCVAAVNQASEQVVTSSDADAHSMPVTHDNSDSELNPYYKDVTVSPDGQYIAALVAHNGHYNLALFDRQQLTRAYFVTDFTDADIDDYHWVNNQYLVFSIDFTGQGASSLYSVARDGGQPVYTIAEGKVNAQQQVVAAEVAALVGDVEDEIIIRYNRRKPEFADFYRVRVSDGTLLKRVKGLPKSTINTWFDAKGEPRLLLLQQAQGIALQQLFLQKPKTVLASSHEPFELMPFAVTATPHQAWVYYQPQDKPAGVYLYDVVEQKFLRELSALQGKVVKNIEFDRQTGEPVVAELAQGQVWLKPQEQAFFQQLQLLFPRKTIRELSRSRDANWLTLLVTDASDSQSYYLIDRQNSLVNLLFVADNQAQEPDGVAR